MPTLVIKHLEKERTWKVEVQEDSFLIGRTRAARICIPDVSVSKEHLRIERRAGDRYRFKDLGSRNGTHLNGFLRREGPLRDGDELRLGKVKITFYKGEAPPGTPSAAGASEPLDVEVLGEEDLVGGGEED
jgi:pSer/pThr/pTyr-binding forkhead associated (FHA) protein